MEIVFYVLVHTASMTFYGYGLYRISKVWMEENKGGYGYDSNYHHLVSISFHFKFGILQVFSILYRITSESNWKWNEGGKKVQKKGKK